MVHAGLPKKVDHTPSPAPGTWSGSMPTASWLRRVLTSLRTPDRSAGAVRICPRARPASISGCSTSLRGGR